MIRENENRLREISAYHLNAPDRFFQAWATETEKDWISSLEITGYQAVRHFNNMLHTLEQIPER
jgi:hypothetical protein